MNSKRLLKYQFSLKYRTGLYERIAAFLEANIDMVNTLKGIRDRYALRKDFRTHILNNWIQKMEKGGKFADAVKEWVPAAEYMMIAAGERGEGLINGLKQAVILSEAAARNKSAITSGLVMPAVLFTFLMLMLVGFQIKMVPVFAGLLPIKRWPASAQLLDTISWSIYHFWWIGILAGAGVISLISATMGTWTGPVRERFDYLPPWSIYKSYQASSFLISLSSLMKAGVANFEAIKTIARNASPWLKIHTTLMMARMRQGESSKALSTGLLDLETEGDVEDYSRLGSFQSAISILGARSLDEGVRKIGVKMAITKNILLAFVAGGVIWIYATSATLQAAVADSLRAVH